MTNTHTTLYLYIPMGLTMPRFLTLWQTLPFFAQLKPYDPIGFSGIRGSDGEWYITNLECSCKPETIETLLRSMDISSDLRNEGGDGCRIVLTEEDLMEWRTLQVAQ